MNPLENKLEWSALEYEDKERSDDWFWALGIIVVAGAAAALIYGNYFFAILIVLGGLLLAVYAKKKPKMVFYVLDEKGLKMDNRIYPYENIKSFWVQTTLSSDSEIEPTLFIKTERIFMPILSIPIEDVIAVQIRDMMLAHNVFEEEMKESPFEQIMEALGF